MTCIVGLEANNKGERTVFLGGDTLGTNDSIQEQYALSKVFAIPTGKRTLLLGYCGTFRNGQILQHALPDIEITHSPGFSDEKFLAMEFSVAVRYVLKEHGHRHEEIGGREEVEAMIVAYNGRIYRFNEDLAFLRPLPKKNPQGTLISHASIGSGHQPAKGALVALDQYELDPETLVLKALKAAEVVVPSVSGPFKILGMTVNGKKETYRKIRTYR